nr:MAG TPA: hypothetical protein [Crassvirales sp.]
MVEVLVSTNCDSKKNAPIYPLGRIGANHFINLTINGK